MKQLLLNLIRKAGYDLISLRKNRTAAALAKEKGAKIISLISPERIVLNGPFKGLKYPAGEIGELTFVPKIAGVYEKQLHDLIERIIATPYEHIIDIGSAEGYYAVGFGLRMPAATVHCFDINETDLRFSKEMAVLNGVENITFNNYCSPQTLINFNHGKRSLIFCDCEGYEFELFSNTVVNALKEADVLIELHDNVNPRITETLARRFEATHDLHMFNNFNQDYSAVKGLEGLSTSDKIFAITEHRGGLYQNIFMQWMFLTPKTI